MSSPTFQVVLTPMFIIAKTRNEFFPETKEEHGWRFDTKNVMFYPPQPTTNQSKQKQSEEPRKHSSSASGARGRGSG